MNFPYFKIREVWSHNLEEELIMLDASLFKFPVLSVDTEFPGCLLKTSKTASDDVRYANLKFNVEKSKMIQLGVTLSNERGTIFATWEFNFRFDVDEDRHSEDSIEFLKQHGIDFTRLKNDGIETERFSAAFSYMLSRHRNLHWVTFQGLYDLAYILHAVTLTPLPESAAEFAVLTQHVLGSVIDVKYMAKFCEGLHGGELGLQRLGDVLGIKRTGGSHNAGSDSLLTAKVLATMMMEFDMNPSIYEGCLYGLDITTQIRRYSCHVVPQYCYGVFEPVMLPRTV
ncbi:hypothetical protein K2173_024362 [Erythroxylum novogranatense]|uniref:poly(A)-specific ribonuclease n=1 Tax=Erythroxylum novogranatense TaxID=1862640 RepID=A0AAV8SU41_9ROSI|nr:hypothetical protein K2173_024362 [Erythroxylum novogranatense]